MEIIDSWVEPGSKNAKRGLRMFHVRLNGGDEHIYTGKGLAKIIGKRWASLSEQGRRWGFLNPRILTIDKRGIKNRLHYNNQ